MVWNSSSMRSRSDKAMVCIDGKAEYLDPGTSFAEIPRLAAKHKMGKFRLWLNGTEISENQAPSSVSAGDRIEIRREDNVA